MNELRWDVAEVLDYDYTYQYIPPSDQSSGNTDTLFSIKVRTVTSLFNNEVFTVRPSNINLKQIPLVGEFVLIYKTFNEYTSKSRRREGWYYVTTIDVHSNINENLLPGITGNLTDTEISNIKPGKTFKSKAVSPLQPYEGDFLLEGRHGNSIRFGSSINTSFPEKYYHASPTWLSPSSDNDGDPIIILANGRKNLKDKEFVIENIEQDASSLYLTSTQHIDTLTLSKDLTIHNYSYAGSQFIGAADRIILRAKKDIAVIDSDMAIVLNTPGEIYIGGEDAEENMVHGKVLESILQKILNQLKSPIQCGTMSGTFLDTSAINSAQSQLKELKNSKYFITKNTI
jgi:hypothetical protein